MSKQHYPEEFKIEAVKEITERGHSVADVAKRIGVGGHSLYAWIKRYGDNSAGRHTSSAFSSVVIRAYFSELFGAWL